MPGLLEGKAVIVTGGGRGVGRGIARLAAAEGSSVVVNDLGVAPSGARTDNPVDDVVAEIKAAGGTAVACRDSVATWVSAQKIVQCAMDSFGRIDGVVNNAGILRDVLFHKLSPEDFDAVLDVNLRGPFFVSRAAAPHFRDQRAGAYIHMTSTAALIGNMGQANYMAAKMGLVGLSASIALDMRHFGVSSNCIAPFAWTAMVSTIPATTPEAQKRVEGLKRLLPERIAPFAVALLCDEGRARVTGQVFGVRNNEIILFSKTRPIQIMHTSDGWTPDSVIERVLPAMEHNFLPPMFSRDVFSWDPV
jgi:NAD(P)-dependent dehydrogenase (short-subunit alcohol dehydrogenase family)